MWYAIVSEDVKNSSALRAATREAHLSRLTALRDKGRLLVAGPCPAVDAVDPGDAGFTGSIVIAEFTDLPAAKQWAAEDPYVAAGVYRDSSVKPFKRVLP